MNRAFLHKYLSGFLTLCVLLILPVLPVCAREGEDAGTPGRRGYTYTVTLSAGEHAKFLDGSDVKKYKDLTLGSTTLSFADALDELRADLERTDSRYYVRGVRLSGQESNLEAPRVERDAIYVVSYGIRGNMVDYTVNYQDEAGNRLAASRVLQGNVGDKPVVAYVYIEGYQPQAYNLTRTLTADSSRNIFTFVYTPVRRTGGGAGETSVIYVPGGTGAAGEAGAGAAGGGTAAAGAAAGGAGAAAGAGAAGGGAGGAGGGAGAGEPGLAEVPDGQTPAAQEPQEIRDLDDEETPLAEGPGGSEDMNGSTGEASARMWILGSGIAAAGLLVLAGSRVLAKRRKKQTDTHEE